MENFKPIPGGICAPAGFSAAGVHCGIRHNHSKLDLALIKADVRCAGAGCYTTNKVYGAPITVDREHLKDGYAQAIVVNSGNANTCAPNGIELAKETCEIVAKELGISADNVLPSSTGVIGQTLRISVIEEGIPALHAALEHSEAASDAAAHAIMTTDTVKKEAAVETVIGGKTVRLGGIAKGSGMIHPNMGTMLCFLTTDCAISPEMIRAALLETVQVSFNRISVDGDTSTNDMCIVLANGMAGNTLIEWQDEEYQAFCKALNEVNTRLARQIAADGEGATKLVTCTVKNSRSEEVAERLAKAVVGSNLVKAAMFGADANWGRVLCAMGYSKAPFRPEYVSVAFESAAGSVAVCEKGAALDFDEELAKKVLSESEVTIAVDVNEGEDSATAWGCDLTYDYVKINGDYRT